MPDPGHLPAVSPGTSAQSVAGLPPGSAQQADLLSLFLLRYGAANTRRSYRNDITQFFGTEEILLAQATAVTFVEINHYLEALATEGAKPATIQRKTAALRGFFSWLVALGVMETNPADRHLVRRFRGPRNRDRAITVLSLEEARRLLEGVDPQSDGFVRDRTLLLVLLHCVLRRSEARGMDFEHLRTVGTHWILDLPMTKGGSDQFVKVPEHVALELLQLKEHYGYESGPIWRSLSNNSYDRRLSSTSIYNIVRKAALRAGLQDGIGAHTLRHTGCTLAIESGASIQQVQTHARHKNLETTMIYVHQRDRLRDSAADYIKL